MKTPIISPRRLRFLSLALLAIGTDAKADEPPDIDSQGRTAAEIVEEARARVEAKVQAERQAKIQEAKIQEAKKQAEGQKERQYYFGFGWADDEIKSRDGAYQLRAAQRDGLPLQYLEPLIDTETRNRSTITFYAGVELTKWLDVELAWHGLDSYYEIFNDVRVFDPTIRNASRNNRAQHFTNFSEESLSLTLMPRWDATPWFAVFGRIGVGYANTSLSSHLSTLGELSTSQSCSKDTSGVETCRTIANYEEFTWHSDKIKGDGFFPIAGLGIQLGQFIRCEYMIRANVPEGDKTTDIYSNLFLSFRMKTGWLDGNP